MTGFDRIWNRNRGEQGLRVGVGRTLVHLEARTVLHDLAQIHDGNAVAHLTHDGEIVGDEDVRQAELSLDVEQEVQHLGPHRDVEGGHRLVTDDELRLEGEGPSHPDALALSARELVGEAIGMVGVQADTVEQVGDLGAPTVPPLTPHDEGLADDVADRHARVEAGVGILEDHLHLPPEPTQVLASGVGDVVALELDVTGRGLDETKDDACRRGLSAPGLTHQAECLPLPDAEVDAVDGVHASDLSLDEHALGDRVVLHQPGHPQQGLSARRRRVFFRLREHRSSPRRARR